MAELESIPLEVDLVGRGDAGSTAISGVSYDSRTVAPGHLFVAIKGVETDGHQYLEAARDAGAAAVVVETLPARPLDLPLVKTADSRRALSRLAAAFYGHPSRQLTLIGLTGTNGKTTTSYLVESVLQAAGYRVGYLGTIDRRFGGKVLPAPTTTPESAEIQALLSEMIRAGITHVILEVSSHALVMDRVEDCHFDVAVFTNLSRDHLDFHPDMEAYFQAKLRLFTEIMPSSAKSSRLAVTNLDDPRGGRIQPPRGAPLLRYGLNPGTDVTARDVDLDLTGARGKISTPEGEIDLDLKLPGRYNLLNALAAGAVGIGLGIEPKIIAAGLAAVRGVPGRLERVTARGGDEPVVLVDYAHTPEALANAVGEVKALTRGRLFTVFGCGGDRDHGKRPLMGAAAGRLSDAVVLTSDNPRTEDPLDIIAMVEPGLRDLGRRPVDPGAARQTGLNGNSYARVPDRSEAIGLAVDLAGPGDVVLIAGKGHEDYQIVGRTKHRFDDREVARAALARRSDR
ncbi:MAG: UDP-N-acetylmuramoyl-L-alanyl-D-glutamate--2,6-diaminopimelate ligase [Proteobacteria bacterium]|nr:UDP-N-acetylmuramoyl-L-alanyl-D-glutamate--2,6-diaminopimelate ligase [Pseudomonadota bacterium]MBU1740183.1 UDP-N-acetylmuramoyl-L-alanyl-D-glutamate--2,6-diaminopimelate ligase [Pseudomonadota bacterium]